MDDLLWLFNPTLPLAYEVLTRVVLKPSAHGFCHFALLFLVFPSAQHLLTLVVDNLVPTALTRDVQLEHYSYSKTTAAEAAAASEASKQAAVLLTAAIAAAAAVSLTADRQTPPTSLHSSSTCCLQPLLVLCHMLSVNNAAPHFHATRPLSTFLLHLSCSSRWLPPLAT